MPNQKLYPCICTDLEYDPLCPACFSRTTSVQILPEHQLILDRFPQITIREALEIGIDIMERFCISMEKIEPENVAKRLRDKRFYDSLEVKNKHYIYTQ